MNKHYQKVKEMMQKAGQDTPDFVHNPNVKTKILRAKLILEEAFELIKAMGVKVDVAEEECEYSHSVSLNINNCGFSVIDDPDFVGIADGVADLTVVTTGTGLAFGIPLEKVQDAVDDSNLDKFRGDAHRREDGKWIKPSDWKAPNLEVIVFENIRTGEES